MTAAVYGFVADLIVSDLMLCREAVQARLQAVPNLRLHVHVEYRGLGRAVLACGEVRGATVNFPVVIGLREIANGGDIVHVLVWLRKECQAQIVLVTTNQYSSCFALQLIERHGFKVAHAGITALTPSAAQLREHLVAHPQTHPLGHLPDIADALAIVASGIEPWCRQAISRQRLIERVAQAHRDAPSPGGWARLSNPQYGAIVDAVLDALQQPASESVSPGSEPAATVTTPEANTHGSDGG